MILQRTDRPARILLVEDNEDDVKLTEHGFARSGIPVEIHHVSDGVECMSYLRKEPPYEGATMPDLILLDLNMPRMTGQEVMVQILADERLRHLPVVVLSTSQRAEEVLEMYQLRINSYFTKPVEFAKFQEVIKKLASYWLNGGFMAKPILP